MAADQVDIRKEVEENYECFYDFLDMVSFEVSKYLKPYLPFRNPEGHALEDPAILSRDVYNTTEQYFKTRCQLDPKKINYEHFASHFAQTYKENLPNTDGGVGMDTKKLKLIEEDIIDVMTDTARKEIYN
jgi:predicted nucleotidyltransferase